MDINKTRNQIQYEYTHIYGTHWKLIGLIETPGYSLNIDYFRLKSMEIDEIQPPTLDFSTRRQVAAEEGACKLPSTQPPRQSKQATHPENTNPLEQYSSKQATILRTTYHLKPECHPRSLSGILALSVIYREVSFPQEF